MYQVTQFIFERRDPNQLADALGKDCRKNLLHVKEIDFIPFPPRFCGQFIDDKCIRLFVAKTNLLMQSFSPNKK